MVEYSMCPAMDCSSCMCQVVRLHWPLLSPHLLTLDGYQQVNKLCADEDMDINCLVKGVSTCTLEFWIIL